MRESASSPTPTLLLSLIGGGALTLLLAAAMFHPSNLIRLMRRKYYQYEVTFSLYMLTPMERFIFNSFLFLFVSMIIIAASLYLPEHICMIANRAWFYYAGDDQHNSPAAVRHVIPGAVETSVAALKSVGAAVAQHGHDSVTGAGAGMAV